MQTFLFDAVPIEIGRPCQHPPNGNLIHLPERCYDDSDLQASVHLMP